MVKSYLTKSASQTKKIGEILVKKVLKTEPKKKALVLALEGSLGSGKTTFLQGFAKGLGIKEKILSPTFIIMRKIKIPKTSNFKPKIFIHLDCYRLKKPKEILDLGFKEIISNPQNIVAIEWAEQIKKFLPSSIIKAEFKFFTGENTRKIIINFPKKI